jgi:Fe-S cluster biosynthesis and repair protein YggX
MATIRCVRCGREAEQMANPPTGGKTGLAIQENVCADCWQEWKSQSILIINHYGLVLADPDHRAQLSRMMREFLNLPEPA